MSKSSNSRKKTAASSSKQKTAKPRASKKNVEEKKAAGIKPFPVVGIGSSAGGLEAFTTFLENLEPHLGMAYVYIQHLSPNHESFLTDIVQRKTKMKVHEVKHNMPLEKNHVYIIPAKYSINITDGKLHLTEQLKGENMHAIDYFLTSLAPVYQQNAIGILLSGTGTDGTIGLMSVKAEGGITFAQDDSATHSGMPSHAAGMGYV